MGKVCACEWVLRTAAMAGTDSGTINGKRGSGAATDYAQRAHEIQRENCRYREVDGGVATQEHGQGTQEVSAAARPTHVLSYVQRMITLSQLYRSAPF